jgi:hypothetical protein
MHSRHAQRQGWRVLPSNGWHCLEPAALHLLRALLQQQGVLKEHIVQIPHELRLLLLVPSHAIVQITVQQLLNVHAQRVL